MGLFNNALKCFNVKLIALLLFVAFTGNAQEMQVNILGGAEVASGTTISITSGNSLTFRITNPAASGCASLLVQSVSSSNSNFSISPVAVSGNIKPTNCRNGTKFLNFSVTRDDTSCSTQETTITIASNKVTFTFVLRIERSPVISVLGGDPLADIVDGTTTTTATNGTYFGVVEGGATVTRTYVIVNTGSCPLEVTSISSSLLNFALGDILLSNFTSTTLPISIDSGDKVYFDVIFTADDPNDNLATISITNNTLDPSDDFTFNVSAEVFDFNIPGPGGVTADFRLWLKATRGVEIDGSDKVTLWKDLGVNGKSASSVSGNEPTYIDDVTSNINFNPVIKFENDGSTEQYLYNTVNGFYSQDIFIVMIPDATITSASSGNTIFAGIKSNLVDPTPVGTITGVGFGNYTSGFTNEVLTYMQESTSTFGIAEISTTKSYANAGIINVRNDADIATTQELLYNSNLLTTSTINAGTFENVGHIDTAPDPDVVWGTKYWIGKNFSETGSLNGRIAEIMTYAERVPDNDNSRQKIESYLAVKYGITLGETLATKDYISSNDAVIWDVNTGVSAQDVFNYNIAGIGRDDDSDLNQKQSKSVNETNEVTIGLGGLYTKNSENTNEFSADLVSLVWGCNNGTFTENGTNTVTIGSGLSSVITKIDRKWKIVETGGDVENIYIGIPETAFSSFPKNANEEYVLIVSDDPSFGDVNIIDAIPLKINVDANGDPVLDKEGSQVYKTWYDFEGTNYFTFGKVPKLIAKSAVNIGSTNFLVGEYKLNLNPFAFTVSVWIKGNNNPSIRTIIAKGSKIQLRLNTINKMEVMVDDDVTPRFTSNMILNDLKWHHIAFVYQSGTIFLYVDGVLDQSTQNVDPPSPNFNRFSIGAVYIDEHTITNPFLGEIDEVCIWNLALTGDQVNYLMNQEIEQNGALVRGKVIQKDIVTMPWAYLAAYYDFNSFYGTTVEGQTDDRFFLRINYRAADKTIIGTQTAPLPYQSNADGLWDTPETWLNNTVQNIPNSESLKAGEDVEGNIVQISHNINSGDRDIKVLGLISTAGELTIEDPIVTDPIELNDGQGLTITHYLELDGIIDLVGESQLIQSEGSVLDEDSGGYIERDQQGTANSFNYNYWSSSVSVIGGNTATLGIGIESTNTGASVSEFLLDGTNSLSPSSIDFSESYTYADGSYTGGKRISTYWLYKFRGGSEDYNAWSSINQNSTLLPGEGYTMKGTSGSEAISTNQNYVFKGKPNNGDISLAISEGQDRLIGNPYPSALDADEFILDNIKTNQTFTDDNGEEKTGRRTENVFNGALYFWHHFGQEDSHNLKEYVGGYATYTLMGGTQAYSISPLIDNSTPSIGGGKVPEKYIPANQGFFVSAYLPSDIDGTTSAVEGGTIMFKNSQRVFERERFTGTNEGSLFFKTNKKSTIIKQENNDERSKIRLKFNSPKGYQRQLLLGVDVNATHNFDIGYDAPIADLGIEDMYWIVKEAKFVIQAVNSFSEMEEFPLGLKIEKTGLISIEIDDLENIDSNTDIFIKDAFLGKTNKINNEPFEITLQAGTYENRFSLTFASQNTLAVHEEILEQGLQIFMSNANSELQIKNTIQAEILSVKLYNSLGQLQNTWKNNIKDVTIILPVNNKVPGMYFVQVKTNTGLFNKKIIID